MAVEGRTPQRPPGEAGVAWCELPNGMLLVVKRRPGLEVAAISVGIRGGSRDEEKRTVGAAHFMEHMYFQGTPTRSGWAEIDGPISSRGGWLNAWTGWESINFQVVIPRRDFGVALEVQADLLVNALFAEEKLDKERRVVLEELNRRLNSPGTNVQDAFARIVFEGHPAFHLPIGDRETIGNSTREVLVAFRDGYFVASNMVVAAVGDFEAEPTFAAIAAAFKGMRTGPHPPFHPAPPPPPRPRTVQIEGPGTQSRLVMGVVAPGSDNDDRYPMDVLTAVLGESGRRLENVVVEQLGLAADIGVAFWELTDVGVWQIWVALAPANVEPTIEVVRKQLQRLRDEPLSDQELQEARAYIRGQTRLGLETNGSQAQHLSDGLALGRYQPIEAYLRHVGRVTADDVQRVARRYLDPEQLTVAILNPAGRA